jgi:hypothetical protein
MGAKREDKRKICVVCGRKYLPTSLDMTDKGFGRPQVVRRDSQVVRRNLQVVQNASQVVRRNLQVVQNAS